MKTIGLACTGGGTKALSNLGVIKALEELNIKISALKIFILIKNLQKIYTK